MERTRENFFEQDPVTCARGLIGCHFVWHGCVGRIVESEAYDAVGDAACHTWFRPSARTFVEAGRAGDAYVYMNYGVHWLFNVLMKGRSGVGSSAYNISNASDDFSDPLGPVITTSSPCGMSHLTK